MRRKNVLAKITSKEDAAAIQRLKTALSNLELTDREIELYIYIRTVGSQPVSEICQTTGLNKNIVQKSLQKLQAMDLVEKISKSPTTYKAMDLKTLFNLLVICISLEVQQLEKIQQKINF
jgi:sugar-specific transcriptional regulator TrmB